MADTKNCLRCGHAASRHKGEACSGGDDCACRVYINPECPSCRAAFVAGGGG